MDGLIYRDLAGSAAAAAGQAPQMTMGS